MQNKKNVAWLVVCLLLCSILNACIAPATATPTPIPTPTLILPTVTPVKSGEVILATGEWEPYTSKNVDSPGAFTEIVMAVFKEMGQPVKLLYYPWKRAESETLAGNVFATFPYIITAEREKDFDFSDPVLISRGKFFYMPERYQSEITYTELADLQAYKIGGVLGYWYETPFKEAGLNTDYTASDNQNIQKLYLDRVDLAATEELVGWMIIKELYPQELKRFATVPKPLNESLLRLMISRTYPDSAALTQRFNATFKAVTEQGVVAQILEKYGVKQ